MCDGYNVMLIKYGVEYVENYYGIVWYKRILVRLDEWIFWEMYGNEGELYGRIMEVISRKLSGKILMLVLNKKDVEFCEMRWERVML